MKKLLFTGVILLFCFLTYAQIPGIPNYFPGIPNYIVDTSNLVQPPSYTIISKLDNQNSIEFIVLDGTKDYILLGAPCTLNNESDRVIKGTISKEGYEKIEIIKGTVTVTFEAIGFQRLIIPADSVRGSKVVVLLTEQELHLKRIE